MFPLILILHNFFPAPVTPGNHLYQYKTQNQNIERRISQSEDFCLPNLGISKSNVERFWKRVKHEFLLNSKEIQKHIELPLTVNSKNSTIIYNQLTFPQDYKNIFDSRFQNVIQSTNTSEFGCTYQGTVLARGLIWEKPFDGTLKIFILNKDVLNWIQY